MLYKMIFSNKLDLFDNKSFHIKICIYAYAICSVAMLMQYAQ
jgi:hypothetical protein